jgi:ribA/ribD-fused uncharacterized protein
MCIMQPVINFYEIGQPYGEFSNFSRHPIMIDGVVYPTSEHYFQSRKFVDPSLRERVRLAATPKEAAAIGRDRTLPMRADWDAVRDIVMQHALRLKFTQHSELMRILVGTGTATLVEHTVNDSYWGDGGDGRGRNRLGELLMMVRAELTNTVHV